MAKSQYIRDKGSDSPARAEHAIQADEQRRRRAYEKAMALQGKVQFDLDIDELRGRNR